MPIRTSLLENGNFVCSPWVPAKPAFSQYLGYADELLTQWRAVQEALRQPSVSPELARKRQVLDSVVRDFAGTFKSRYAMKGVQRDPAFLPLAQCFAKCRPFAEPFSVLHCDQEMPLHTVRVFQSQEDLAGVNAALNEQTPLQWWETGPHERPCYLWGDCVWELRPSEMAASDPGRVILLRDTAEDDRQKLNRLKQGDPEATRTDDGEFIPEKVRVAVFRRAGGKCEKCGGRQGLDYECLAAVKKGANHSPDSVRLVCGRCRARPRS